MIFVLSFLSTCKPQVSLENIFLALLCVLTCSQPGRFHQKTFQKKPRNTAIDQNENTKTFKYVRHESETFNDHFSAIYAGDENRRDGVRKQQVPGITLA